MAKVRLVCGNCGKIETVEAETAQAAFQAFFERGWDTVERFGYNACEQCPGVAVYFPMYFAQEAREVASQEQRAALLERVATETTKYENVKFPAYEEKP